MSERAATCDLSWDIKNSNISCDSNAILPEELENREALLDFEGENISLHGKLIRENTYGQSSMLLNGGIGINSCPSPP